MCERYLLQLKEVTCNKRIVHLCLLHSECQCVVVEIISGTKDERVTNPYERANTYWYFFFSFETNKAVLTYAAASDLDVLSK